MTAHAQALELRRPLGDRLGIASSLRGLGRAQFGLKEYALARESLAESARLFMAADAQPGHASSLLALAHTEASAGNTALASRLAARAVHLLRSLSPNEQSANGPDGAQLLRQAEQLAASLGG